eukprot:289783_1
MDELGRYIINPSGDCGVDTSDGAGSRPQYNYSPSGRTIYVPDCKNPLKREYWRVFVVEPNGDDSSVYIIPRPDNMGTKYGYCCDGDDELCELFEKNGLCSSIINAETVQKINTIPLDEALIMMNKLHQKLTFIPNYYDECADVSPWAPDDDILEICDSGITIDTNVLGHCDALRTRCNDNGMCMDRGILMSEDAARALVPLMNDLYGISTFDISTVTNDDNGDNAASYIGMALPSVLFLAWWAGSIFM